MIMNKKGLSDVVTTVLIILLAIAAIVIVWNFVSPTLENAGSQIESQTACLDASVVAVSCTKPVSPATTGTITFRNDGGQAVYVKKIQWVSDFSECKIFMPNGEFKEGYADSGIKNIKVGEIVQFERFGFCRLDKKDKKGYEFWFAHM